MIYQNCNLCGKDNWRLRYPATGKNSAEPSVDAFRCTSPGYGNHPQIVQCNNCGHVYANPRWLGSELLELYEAVEDETYVTERLGREKTFAKHLRAIEKITGPGSGRHLLDVGAYVGVFVEVACKQGWQAIGVEPSDWATSNALAREIPVFQGTLEAPELEGRQFDVITLWDVIEHVDDPSAELAKCYELLKPGGMIAIHTMDVNSLTASLMGQRWPWLMDMHVHYFSRKSMRLFLEKNHFEIIWEGTQGRYLSLGYLLSRIAGLSAIAGKVIASLVRFAGLEEVLVPVNFGDLFTAYARRPDEGES
jgi:SAM-dependent methyltransferase